MPQLPGFTVEVLPQVDSTNSELMRRARAGDMAPVLLVARSKPQAGAAWGGVGSATRGLSSPFRSGYRWRRATGQACRWPWA